MKIALITFEYPRETHFGGIATYMFQLAEMLKNRGHIVEVFTATFSNSYFYIENGIRINRCKVDTRENFKDLVPLLFAARDNEIKFDIIESCEFGADALNIEKVSRKPLVIKLHCPRFLISDINYRLSKKKYLLILKQIARKVFPSKRFYYQPLIYNYKKDDEYITVKKANLITVPSFQLREIVSKKWKLKKESIVVIPNPYEPSKELLSIKSKSSDYYITFVGRFEKLKGISIFEEVMASVFVKFPNIKFRFVGEIQNYPEKDILINEYYKIRFPSYFDRIEFTGKISNDQIYKCFEDTLLCMIPSYWENFPGVCLEAMSAGKVVIASKVGGLIDIIEHNIDGILVNVDDVEGYLKYIEINIKSFDFRLKMGENARNKILRNYNTERIGSLIVNEYKKIISDD